MYLKLIVGLTEGLEDVVARLEEVRADVAVEVEVLDVVEEVTVELLAWYRVNPLGPPHIKLELPAQVILQRPSVAGVLPPPKTLPQ